MSQSVLITGGAGFIGSHLTNAHLKQGDQVTVLDSLVTGSNKNLNSATAFAHFSFIKATVEDEKAISQLPRFDLIYHLASPASPLLTSKKSYHQNPLVTLRANSFGTYYLAQKATTEQSKLIFASSSEVYGDPLEHPQIETYFGHVNPVGPRALYDESKRFGEACLTTFATHFGLKTGIARIFNTYGPRLGLDDGRFISEVIKAGLTGSTFTLYGSGEQTRSFCYIDDLITGLILFSQLPDLAGTVINLGNDEELTINQVLDTAGDIFGQPLKITKKPLQVDDPTRRRPDISKAKRLLNWQPRTRLKVGLTKMLEYQKSQ